MRPINALAVTCLLAWLPVTSPAQALYKCRGPDGALSYQDHECAADAEDLAPPVIAPPPRDPYVPDLADPTPAPAGALAGQPAATPRRRVPMPRLYYCQKPEGGDYTTTAPNLQPRQVPLWTLDRYSPTFGRGLGASGALYTTVVDYCRVLGRGETCAYVRKRLGKAQDEARLAFNDTRGALEGEVADLREQIASNCL